MSRAHRAYWTTCAVLGVVALLWLLPTLWMVSLSFQPNDVLSRTTANVALGLIPRRSPGRTSSACSRWA